ncbi:MAG TPA: PepSY domain-containing protein [Kaistia sp.]|nr:PepSY domain-containing protein [Kaistia sp.]
MSATSHPAPAVNPFYFAAWRWHFYAGLFVIPFLMMLALTGGVMMIYSSVSNELGQAPNVVASGPALPVSAQARAAAAAVPGGMLTTFIAPESATRPAFFELSKDGASFAVAVDPYKGTVLNAQNEATTIRALAERIHGTLLIGDLGDRLIEAAASLTILLIATGLYLWWPRSGGLVQAFVPRLSARGRGLWKELHKATGIWIAAFLFLFMLSGLAWTGIWGDKFVKPWSSFPAEKWDNVPLSDLTHASLNLSPLHEVPWGLELTPLPASGSAAGRPAVPQPVVLDTVAQWAAANGFAGQYRLSLPMSETGVYTVSIDARNGDGFTPSDDRFVHIDQYTGNILADIRYADYKPVAKLMAWGIGLHKGMAGTWNFVFNLVYLALVLFLCVSGIVMWWKRRPSGVGRLAAPPMPRELPLWKGAILVGLAVSLAFPMAGIALICVLAVDMLVLTRVPALKRAFS